MRKLQAKLTKPRPSIEPERFRRAAALHAGSMVLVRMMEAGREGRENGTVCV